MVLSRSKFYFFTVCLAVLSGCGAEIPYNFDLVTAREISDKKRVSKEVILHLNPTIQGWFLGAPKRSGAPFIISAEINSAKPQLKIVDIALLDISQEEASLDVFLPQGWVTYGQSSRIKQLAQLNIDPTQEKEVCLLFTFSRAGNTYPQRTCWLLKRKKGVQKMSLRTFLRQ